MSEGEREPGLNRLEVVVTALHASAWASLAGLFVVPVMRRASLGMPGVSILGGLFVTWWLVLLGLASRRPPRLALSRGDQLLLILSGLFTGTAGVLALAMAL